MPKEKVTGGKDFEGIIATGSGSRTARLKEGRYQEMSDEQNDESLRDRRNAKLPDFEED